MSRDGLRLLRFAIQYPGWHAFTDSNRKARRALWSLADHGLVIVSRGGPVFDNVSRRWRNPIKWRLALPEYYLAASTDGFGQTG